MLGRARSVLDRNETLAGELADALIASGVVDQAVEDGIDERFKDHVESRTAKIATDIQERVASEREKLKDLVRQRDEFESASRTARADLDRELDAARARHRVEIEEERAALEREEEQLIRKRQAVEKQLEAVTARFVSARDDVVGDLLALAPLLNRVGFPVGSETPPPNEAPALEPGGRQEFKLRPYLSKPLAGSEITEIEFFERFKTARRGFRLRVRPPGPRRLSRQLQGIRSDGSGRRVGDREVESAAAVHTGVGRRRLRLGRPLPDGGRQPVLARCW